ncbi:hypothetical protein [Gryllotalpicola sp.]|uniref:hypothetical protein n=1 Tax=Gryllotalpicola sp. TaxID=1932787 RepID=UPI002637D1D4|nr:hypothetical protein [Gryllotalpicola sp.]
MGSNLLSGGLVIVVAAVLWLLYLIPTWLRRREYSATERNAVKLQQTLRILAQAAEVPEPVANEARARRMAVTQRALRKVEKLESRKDRLHAEKLAKAEAELRASERARAEAVARAEAAAEAEVRAWAEAEARARAAARQAKIDAAVRAAREAGVHTAKGSSSARAARRGRLGASGFLAVGVAGAVLSVVFGLSSVFALVGGLLALAAVAVLAAIANRQAAARAAAAAIRRSGRSVPPGAVYDHAFRDEGVAVERHAEAETWTPQPLPRPLHLARGTVAASTMAAVTAAAELRRAQVRAEIEARYSSLGAEVTPLPTAPRRPTGVQSVPLETTAAPGAGPQQSALAARLAAMGVVGDGATESIDVAAALVRRRA